MKALLYTAAALLLVASLILLGLSKSAIHEGVTAIVFLGAIILFVGAVITGRLERLTENKEAASAPYDARGPTKQESIPTKAIPAGPYQTPEEHMKALVTAEEKMRAALNA